MSLSISERDQARFWAKVDTSGECWEWLGGKVGKGYGVMSVGGRKNPDGSRRNPMMLATRIAWIIATGEDPRPAWVLHHCDNPGCVRFEHLFLGDALSNVRDMDQKGRRVAYVMYGDDNPSRRYPDRRPRGETHANAKLTAADVAAIRAAFTGGEQRQALARHYEVSWTLINYIVQGKVWKGVG